LRRSLKSKPEVPEAPAEVRAAAKVPVQTGMIKKVRLPTVVEVVAGVPAESGRRAEAQAQKAQARAEALHETRL